MTHRTTRRPSRWGELLAVVLLAVAALVAPGAVGTASAQIQSGETVYIGDRTTGSGNSTALFEIHSDGPPDSDPDYFAYCIERHVSARQHTEAHVGDLDSFLGNNQFASDPAVQSKVFWIINNSYPALSLEEFGVAAGAPGISTADAIEATQLAIWYFTDDHQPGRTSADSSTAFQYLVGGAEQAPQSLPQPATPEVSITGPDAPTTAGTLAGPFTVSTNQDGAVVVVDPSLPVTDAQGTAIDTSDLRDGESFHLDLREITHRLARRRIAHPRVHRRRLLRRGLAG